MWNAPKTNKNLEHSNPKHPGNTPKNISKLEPDIHHQNISPNLEVCCRRRSLSPFFIARLFALLLLWFPLCSLRSYDWTICHISCPAVGLQIAVAAGHRSRRFGTLRLLLGVVAAFSGWWEGQKQGYAVLRWIWWIFVPFWRFSAILGGEVLDCAFVCTSRRLGGSLLTTLGGFSGFLGHLS